MEYLIKLLFYLTSPFKTILTFKRAIVTFFATSPNPRNFMLYLAAAVSDFYIPIKNMSIHKLSRGEEKHIKFDMFIVPKTLLELRNTSKEMFMVMFKVI